MPRASFPFGDRARALAHGALRRVWPLHLLLSTLALPGPAFLGEALFDRDLHCDWYPRIRVIAQTLVRAYLPTWDLTIGFGHPLLADPGAQVLYPTTWLALLLPAHVVYTLFVLGHLSFSATGLTRLARALGLGRLPALLAGAAWILGGPMLSLVNAWHHFAGAAWMPWVVLAAHRLARRSDARGVLQLGACLALQELAGSGDVLLMTGGLCVAWIVATSSPRRFARLLRLVPGVALALALSAVQWMPTLELAARSARRDLPESTRVQWSQSPTGFLGLVVPLDSSGRLAYTPATQEALFGSARQPFLGSVYLGTLMPALTLLGCFGRRRRLALGLLLIGGLAALVAVGPATPVNGWTAALIPGAGHLRYPSKVMIVVGFAAALLAGLGLDALPRGRALRVAAVPTLGLALGLALLAALLGPGLGQAIAWRLLAERPGVEGDVALALTSFLAHALLALLGGVLLLHGRPAPRLPAGLALVLVVDLWLANRGLNPSVDPRMLAVVPPVVLQLDRSPGARTYVYDYVSRSSGALERLLGRPWAYTVAQPPAEIDPRPWGALAQRIYPIPPAIGFWDVESSFTGDLRGLQPLFVNELVQLLRDVEGTPAHRRLLALGGVHSVIALHQQGFSDLLPGPSTASLFPGQIYTYRVPDPLPRAYAVGRVRIADGLDARRALVDPGFEPLQEAILAAAPAALLGGSGGTVQIRELFAGRETLDVVMQGPGLVVSVDAWDPNWRAWVDGEPAPVLRANVAFRAVPVGSGHHVVEMAHRPPALALGAVVSVLGLMVGAALARRARP